jgi:acylphosphatase
MKKATIIQVYGRVQGVGFRFYTQKKAVELRITGHVRNRPDGSVYIEASGEAGNMDSFIKWCEEGPTWAHVSKMDKQDIPVFQADDFRIK